MGHEIAFGVILSLYVTSSVLLYIYGINSYVMIWLFMKTRKRRETEERLLAETTGAASEQQLPIVTTQLPVYNERHVIERLIRSVAALEYPRDKHEIQVLDDSTDDTPQIAAAVIDELREDGYWIHHIRRTERAGYKAGALAEGMKRASGEHLAIFDADFVPQPDFLMKTIPYLLADDRCGFVQTRWGHRNRGISYLTFAQSIGIDGHFVVEQPARAWSGLFFNFNGTAGVWRRSAIEDAGGWTADTLTEDLDLSYRTLLSGWRARYLLNVVTPAEVPTNINALKSQQRRWAQGSIETAMKLLPVLWKRRDFSLFRRLQATIHLTHYFIHPLILLITILVLPLLLLIPHEMKGAYVAPLIAMMFLALLGPSTLYVFSQGVSGGSWLRTVFWMPALMALGIGLAVNNTRAVFNGLRRKAIPFERTPKLGAYAEQSSLLRQKIPIPGSYTQPLEWTYAFEIATGIWAGAAFIESMKTMNGSGSAFLLIQTIGFLFVGIMSLRHSRLYGRSA